MQYISLTLKLFRNENLKSKEIGKHNLSLMQIYSWQMRL